MTGINFDLLPNFLIIGAAKAGTTSLHDVLGQHPQIFTTQIKEAQFFNNDKYLLGLKWYQDNYFYDATGYPARGESSPGYLSNSQIVSPRLKETFEGRELKLIAIFRDPVKRAYSHYWFRVHRGKEKATSFEDALASEFCGERTPNLSYFWMGCYASLLQPFLENFPHDRFHFLLMDDIINDFQPSLAKTAHFLGANESFTFTSVTDNPSSVYKNKWPIKFLRDESDPLHKAGKIIAKLMPRKQVHTLGTALFRSNLRPEKYPPLDGRTETDLRSRYKDEIIRLEGIINRDLSCWYAQ
jgi:hypothetical protein